MADEAGQLGVGLENIPDGFTDSGIGDFGAEGAGLDVADRSDQLSWRNQIARQRPEAKTAPTRRTSRRW